MNRFCFTLLTLLLTTGANLLVFISPVMALDNPSFFKGFTAMNEGHYDEAAMFLRISIKANPDYLPAYSHLGLVYERKKEFDKAKEVWQQYTEFESYFQDTVKKHIELIDTYIEAEKYSSDNNISESTVLFAEVVASDKYPMSVIWLYAANKLGRIYFNSGNYVQLIPLYEKIELHYPKDITKEILYQYACSYQKEKEYEKAIKVYKKLDKLFKIEQDKISIYKNMVALCYEGIGDEYFVTEDYQKAKNTYSPILQGFPDAKNIERVRQKKLKAEENLAFYYKAEADSNLREKQYSKADEYYQKILTECNQSSHYNYAQEAVAKLANLAKNILNKAMEAHGKQKYSEAVESYQDFIKYFPKNKETAWAKFRMGMSYAASGKARESVAILMNMAKEHPEHNWADIALERAGLYCWQAIGNEKQAEKIFRYIVKKYPKGRATDNALYYLGVIYINKENYKSAYYSLKGLLDHFPDSNLRKRAKIGILHIQKEVKKRQG